MRPFFLRLAGILTVLAPVLLSQNHLAAQPAAYKIPGSLYIQDFDGLPATGSFSLNGKGPFFLSGGPFHAVHLNGWQIWQNGGSGKNAAFLPGSGSSTGQGMYSLGTSGSSERALGSLSSGTGMYAFGLILTNQTDTLLTTCTIHFTAEQWRKGGSGNLNTWRFSYQTGELYGISDTLLMPAPAGNFSSIQTGSGAGSLNGNLPVNRQSYTLTLKNINWQPGQQLVLRWDDMDDSGSDDAMALDDFSFMAENSPSSPTADSVKALEITDTSLLLQIPIHTNGAESMVQVAYDTVKGFPNPTLLPLLTKMFPAGNLADTLLTAITGLTPATRYFIRFITINLAGTDTTIAAFSTNQVPAPPAAIKDSVPPKLKSILFPAEGIYASSDTLAYIFSFTESVYISDSAPLTCKITIGSKTRYAVYHSGNGTDQLSFRYCIVPGDKDADGVKTATLTGLSNPFDSTGNRADITGKQFSSPNKIIVDAVQPEISEVTLPEPGDYFTGDTLWFHVHYTKNLRTLPETSPVFLPIIIGKTTVKAQLYAADTTTLIFHCPITDTYWDTSGISFTGAISDSLAQLKDTLGNIALLNLHYAGSMRNIRIHPGIIQPKELIAPAAGWYRQGDSLQFTLVYSEPAFLQLKSSDPSIDFIVNGSTKKAAYQNGSGTSVWHFRYIVPNALFAPEGILLSELVHQSKNSIRDKWGNPAPAYIIQVPDGGSVKIDALAPIIDHTDLPRDGVYGLGKQLLATLYFSEPVFLASPADSVYLAVTIGNVQRKMHPVSGTGTDTWQFIYTVQPGDLDKNGISFSGSLYYTSAAPVDAAGNIVNTSLHLSGSSAGIWVDGYSPKFLQADNDTLRYCADNSSILINEPFGITDEEAGELVSWRIITLPGNGTIAQSAFSRNTSEKQLLPQDWQYQPLPGWTGIDSLVTEVTDGANSIRKKVLIQVHMPIQDNTISRSQVICSGSKPEPITGTLPTGGYAHYTCTWESSSLNEKDGYATCNDSASLQMLRINAVQKDTWIRRRIFSGNCQHVSEPVFIHARQNGIWLGYSANWHDTANWCGHTIPDATTDVLLQKQVSLSPVINGKGGCHDLWIQDSIQLHINGELEISGAMHAGTASIDAINGRIIFSGNQEQWLSGNWLTRHTISSLLLDNQLGLMLQDSILLSHSLKMRKGMITTNSQLYLSPDAFIEPAAKQTGLAGNVSLSYRFRNKKPAYYLLQHPFVEDIDWRQIGNSIILTGPGGAANGFADTTANLTSLYSYDTMSGNDSLGFESGWQAIRAITADSSSHWKSNQPIRLLFQGMRDSLIPAQPDRQSSSSCLNLSGAVLTGDKENNIPQGLAGRYIIIGNPYIAAINPANITKTDNISRYYWRWLPAQGKNGGYTVYPFDKSQSISPWETIIVQVLNNEPAGVFFSEQSKTENKAKDIIETAEPYDGYHIELQVWQDSSCLDRLLLVGMDSARSSKDVNDAPKIKNPDLDLYSISRDGHRLSADARSFTTNATIPLGIRSRETGNFTLTFANAFLPVTNQLQLHDIYANRWVPLIKGSTYAFDINSDSTSQGDHRFELAVPITVSVRQQDQVRISLKLNPVPARSFVQIQYMAREAGNTELRIMDAAGRIWQNMSLGNQKAGSLRIKLSYLPTGIYYAQLHIGDSFATAGFVKQ